MTLGAADTAAACVATVVPDVTGLDKQFDYLIPPELSAHVRVGTLVRVELHGRRIGGWVASISDAPSDGRTIDSLKPIAKVTGHGPDAGRCSTSPSGHRSAGPLGGSDHSSSPPRRDEPSRPCPGVIAPA